MSLNAPPAGLQFTAATESLGLSGQIDWIAGSGVRPRLAVNLGYAF